MSPERQAAADRADELADMPDTNFHPLITLLLLCSIIGIPFVIANIAQGLRHRAEYQAACKKAGY